MHLAGWSRWLPHHAPREARPDSPSLPRPPPRVGPLVRVLRAWRGGVAGRGRVPHRARRRRGHGGPVQLHRARRQGLCGRALRPAELQSGGGLGDAASLAHRRRLPRGGGDPACWREWPAGGATARQPGLYSDGCGPAGCWAALRTRETSPARSDRHDRPRCHPRRATTLELSLTQHTPNPSLTPALTLPPTPRRTGGRCSS